MFKSVYPLFYQQGRISKQRLQTTHPTIWNTTVGRESFPKLHSTQLCAQEASSSSTGSFLVPVTLCTEFAPDASGHIADLRLADLVPASHLNPMAAPFIPKPAGVKGKTPKTKKIAIPAADEEPEEWDDACPELPKWALHDKRPVRAPEPTLEARFMNRYPPNFGAKVDGPLTSLMALSGPLSQNETGRPDYDKLFHRQVNGSSEPCATESLEAGPAESAAHTAARDPDARQKNETCSVDTSGSAEATSECSPPSPDSLASTTSTRLATSSDETAVESQPNSSHQELKTKSVVYGPGGKKFSLLASCRGHVVAGIAKEFCIPEEEQHLLQESSLQPNIDFYRVERKMDARKLRFTQSSISDTFRDGRPLFGLLNDLNFQEVDPLRELEPLDVVWHNGFWHSLSNRRLWALKYCIMATTGQPLFVRVRVRQPDGEFRSKFTSENGGVTVKITSSRSRSASPTAAKFTVV